MPLIVEDGTGTNVAADSYVSEADIIAYAAARGVTVPNDAAATLAGVKAMDYLEVQHFKGSHVLEGVQPLQWPRQNVKISLTTLASDVIPIGLKNAQCELAMQSFNGIDLLPSRAAEQAIKSETIGGSSTGQIVTEYFAPAPDVPLLTRAEALLRPLLSVGFNDILVVRA